MTIIPAKMEDTRLVYVDEMEGNRPKAGQGKDELIIFNVHRSGYI